MHNFIQFTPRDIYVHQKEIRSIKYDYIEKTLSELKSENFAEEIIEKIGIETIRAELDAALLNRLKTEI